MPVPLTIAALLALIAAKEGAELVLETLGTTADGIQAAGVIVDWAKAQDGVAVQPALVNIKRTQGDQLLHSGRGDEASVKATSWTSRTRQLNAPEAPLVTLRHRRGGGDYVTFGLCPTWTSQTVMGLVGVSSRHGFATSVGSQLAIGFFAPDVSAGATDASASPWTPLGFAGWINPFGTGFTQFAGLTLVGASDRQSTIYQAQGSCVADAGGVEFGPSGWQIWPK